MGFACYAKYPSVRSYHGLTLSNGVQRRERSTSSLSRSSNSNGCTLSSSSDAFLAYPSLEKCSVRDMPSTRLSDLTAADASSWVHYILTYEASRSAPLALRRLFLQQTKEYQLLPFRPHRSLNKSDRLVSVPRPLDFIRLLFFLASKSCGVEGQALAVDVSYVFFSLLSKPAHPEAKWDDVWGENALDAVSLKKEVVRIMLKNVLHGEAALIWLGKVFQVIPCGRDEGRAVPLAHSSLRVWEEGEGGVEDSALVSLPPLCALLVQRLFDTPDFDLESYIQFFKPSLAYIAPLKVPRKKKVDMAMPGPHRCDDPDLYTVMRDDASMSLFLGHVLEATANSSTDITLHMLELVFHKNFVDVTKSLEHCAAVAASKKDMIKLKQLLEFHSRHVEELELRHPSHTPSSPSSSMEQDTSYRKLSRSSESIQLVLHGAYAKWIPLKWLVKRWASSWEANPAPDAGTKAFSRPQPLHFCPTLLGKCTRASLQLSEADEPPPSCTARSTKCDQRQSVLNSIDSATKLVKMLQEKSNLRGVVSMVFEVLQFTAKAQKIIFQTFITSEAALNSLRVPLERPSLLDMMQHVSRSAIEMYALLHKSICNSPAISSEDLPRVMACMELLCQSLTGVIDVKQEGEVIPLPVMCLPIEVSLAEYGRSRKSEEDKKLCKVREFICSTVWCDFISLHHHCSTPSAFMNIHGAKLLPFVILSMAERMSSNPFEKNRATLQHEIDKLKDYWLRISSSGLIVDLLHDPQAFVASAPAGKDSVERCTIATVLLYAGICDGMSDMVPTSKTVSSSSKGYTAGATSSTVISWIRTAHPLYRGFLLKLLRHYPLMYHYPSLDQLNLTVYTVLDGLTGSSLVPSAQKGQAAAWALSKATFFFLETLYHMGSPPSKDLMRVVDKLIQSLPGAGSWYTSSLEHMVDFSRGDQSPGAVVVLTARAVLQITSDALTVLPFAQLANFIRSQIASDIESSGIISSQSLASTGTDIPISFVLTFEAMLYISTLVNGSLKEKVSRENLAVILKALGQPIQGADAISGVSFSLMPPLDLRRMKPQRCLLERNAVRDSDFLNQLFLERTSVGALSGVEGLPEAWQLAELASRRCDIHHRPVVYLWRGEVAGSRRLRPTSSKVLGNSPQGKAGSLLPREALARDGAELIDAVVQEWLPGVHLLSMRRAQLRKTAQEIRALLKSSEKRQSCSPSAMYRTSIEERNQVSQLSEKPTRSVRSSPDSLLRRLSLRK